MKLQSNKLQGGYKMKNTTLLVLMTLVLSIGMASAVSLQLKNSTGTVVIDFSSTGDIDAEGNITAGLFFVGDGRYLTNLVVAADSVTIAGENITSGTINFARLPTLTDMITLAYQNITGVPSCSAGQFVKMNATGWICESPVIAMTDTHTHAYQNITGVPACTAGQYVVMNATGWICETPATFAMDYTNIAMTNKTNTFANDQIFSNDVNVTGAVNLLSATASIKRGLSNITIDNSNNVIITLG